ncbi:MAG: sulfatase-like hydrolase/transferase [Clostridiales bacterium]|nr:sulfatase-like hydrolase/transferase [Clostridiales bacterium]
MAKKLPNILFFGMDSLRRDHMSHYGYHRLTTPHISAYAKGGVTFENCFSPHIPTTPGYANMVTGRDCFGTGVVGLTQKKIVEGVPVLAEMLRERGYDTTCIGFEGNAAGRGYDKYISFPGWGPDHDDGRAHKAQNLNEVAIPEMERLAKGDKPWLLFLRHMDPHSPYLAPQPFQDMFWQGDGFDPNDKRMQKVYDFKPFGDYIGSWVPKGLTNPDYVIAQYDAAVAYMDAAIQQILVKLRHLGLEEDTIVVFTSDHGETLYDHDCYFDHHGLYDPTLVVPFIVVWKNHLPGGVRIGDTMQLKDITPTLLDMMGVDTGLTFEGRSLMPLIRGGHREKEDEFYITECTWMRKHGWRTPEWKLMISLEPDFHYKPPVELYNLVNDPEEYDNLAESRPETVKLLTEKMNAFIEKRVRETGRPSPIEVNFLRPEGPFKTSDAAYAGKYIGGIADAVALQKKG